MHDELPAPPTTEESIADVTAESADGPGSAADPELESTDDRRERDDRPGHDDEAPATGSSPPRSRDGVDPPDGEATIATDDDSDCDGDDPDEDPLAYRLERLRLWRTLATLAVVVARLIRSL